MQLAARIGTMARSGKRLPYLRKVAFLESHGTEFINTGITNDDGINFRIDVECTIESSVRRFILGDTDTGARGRGYLERNVDGKIAGTRISSIQFNIGVRYRIELKDEVVTIDDGTGPVIISSPRWGLNSVGTSPNFRIFDINYGASAYRFIGKLYGFSLSKGDVVVLDKIPVLDLSGRPCLYNQAPSAVPTTDPSRYFYNAGTGEFTWGELDTSSALVSSMGMVGGGITANA